MKLGGHRNARRSSGAARPRFALGPARGLPFFAAASRSPFFEVAKVQRQAMVGSDSDPLEREAESIAQQVNTGEEEPALLKRSAAASPAGGVPAPPEVARAIESRKGSGRSLSNSERSLYEPRLGADLGAVRLHADAPAAELAASLQANAFTSGQDVFFGAGQYTGSGERANQLLAHELVHTVQQAGTSGTSAIRRRTLIGPATGAPADWSTKVGKATTSAQKAALIQQATGVVTVDVTAKTAGDPKVDKTKLVSYSASSQQINYDDGLNSKKSIGGRKLSRNAGYTINSAKNYVVLGPKALDGNRYFQTRRILSHEFDHVRQAAAGGKLAGNESELDAWTTSFIRDFHRSYVLGKSGTDCYIYSYPSWNPLLEYYVRKNVRDTERDRAIKRIKTYYAATIKPHAAHVRVFRSWVHKRIKTAGAKFDDLPVRLNSELKLVAGASDKLPARFKCSVLSGVTYPKAPEVAKP